ncbi:MAG: DUF192 domain-containing protein [Patescibacteria group bacterium]
MKKILLALLIIVCALLLGVAFMLKNNEEISVEGTDLATTTLSWDGGSFIVEIADTSASRTQGLSDREELLRGHGMLFVFPKDDFYSFWMKDMRFSIDMLWLSSDFRVVHIVSAVSPETYPESFTSPDSARYVLEIPSGESLTKGVVVGTQFVAPSF